MKDNSMSPLYDSEEFRKHGHELIDILADYLKEAVSGGNMPVLPWKEPDDLVKEFSFDNPENDDITLSEFIRKVIDNMNHLHHPRFVGHQNTPPLNAGILAQMCTTLLNNGTAVYEMGPAAMAAERNVARYMARLVGFDDDSDGIFTHGGSAGNLTALLAVRQSKSDYNVWEDGIRNNRKMGIIVSDMSHYSISRNIRVIGMGSESVLKIPHDGRYAMKTSMLRQTMKEAEAKGIKVAAVAANACSTATGTYDNLLEISEFCSDNNLWFHVDGAHGLGVLFSDKYRDLVKGIEHADSVVLDFHKMFLTPGLNTLVLFRNGGRSYETFSQKATYLFDKNSDKVWYNGAGRTLECTKSAMGIAAWAVIRFYGQKGLGDYIESRYDLARRFAGKIEDDPGLELAVIPESNIVCFRFLGEGASESELNRLNSMIRRAIIESGRYYLVQTDLGGRIYLRTSLMNAITSDNDLDDLLGMVKEYGSRIRASAT